MTDTYSISDGIAANLALLDHTLYATARTARSASVALKTGNRNLAIGTLLPMVEELKLASALLETIFTLHRLPRMEKGGVQ